jgi:hypothetical protein
VPLQIAEPAIQFPDLSSGDIPELGDRCFHPLGAAIEVRADLEQFDGVAVNAEVMAQLVA